MVGPMPIRTSASYSTSTTTQSNRQMNDGIQPLRTSKSYGNQANRPIDPMNPLNHPRLLTPKAATEYPKMEETMRMMKTQLVRFTRANDRRMVLRTLKEVKYLKHLHVKPRRNPEVNLEEFEMEIARENVSLNGHLFEKHSKYGRTSSDFLQVLHELCYRLCDGLANSPDTLYYDLLSRLARTVTSADAYNALESALECQELILMQAGDDKKSKGMNRKYRLDLHPPIELTLYESDGHIHAIILTKLNFGLYRKADINTGRPWIKMQANLVDRTNFTNGRNVRHVSANWPDMYV